jgi:hypothetical protein
MIGTTPDLLPVSLDTMIDEVRRELNHRRFAYPRLVADKKLNANRAGRQIEIMDAILELLIKLNSPDPSRRLAA